MESRNSGEDNPVLRRGAHIAIGVPKGDALLVEVDFGPERWVLSSPLADTRMVSGVYFFDRELFFEYSL